MGSSIWIIRSTCSASRNNGFLTYDRTSFNGIKSNFRSVLTQIFCIRVEISMPFENGLWRDHLIDPGMGSDLTDEQGAFKFGDDGRCLSTDIRFVDSI